MRKLGIAIDDIFKMHDNGYGHPESPDRIRVINDMLINTGLMNKVELIEPFDALKEHITLVHKARHFDLIESTRGRERVNLDADTSTSPKSFEAAIRAAGAMIKSIDLVMKNDLEAAFPLVRPPGHHAEIDRAMGFCLFNNIAVGAAYLINNYDVNRILIVDWDLHHGNGTQHMFYDTDKVFYISTHQFPYYPGTGAANEIGIGEGEGFTLNIPMNPGMGDQEYIKIFFELLKPVIDQYKPQIILVSAGFDTHIADPLGGMAVTTKGFQNMTKLLNELADEHCGGKIIYILEGGYNLEGLWHSVHAVIQELLMLNNTDYLDYSNTTKVDQLINGIMEINSKYWKF